MKNLTRLTIDAFDCKIYNSGLIKLCENLGFMENLIHLDLILAYIYLY